ncbi:hypothetical protein ACE103_12535 [Bradyrhizobium sp. ma5]|uniref:hypothetical protein n=1 Tax=Bradyrhizobium sp. ma5 TaxID=3344828 RepID=UPI0035D5131E
MTTLRIYDYRDGVLALDLSDLVDLLAPRSLEASWTASPVRVNHPDLGRFCDEFMVVGQGKAGQHPLEVLAANGSSFDGIRFSEAAHTARQVIWGQFVAALSEQDDHWVDIRAIDSTFYEVTTSDKAVLNAVWASYKDVRVASGPTISVPIDRI